LIETVGFSSGDVVLGWMPLDHGTGFARHVRATYTGCRQVYAPRESFMADPLRWLDWIVRHRVTDTEAPNFAYGLVNARAEEIAHRCWDLSSIKFILNIAETIVERTAARFLELGQPHGLSPAAMRPIYGMSETGTLTCASAVAAGGSDVGDPGAGLVEVGSPTPGVSIRIVDAGGRVVSEGTLGRIHARDPMVTSVYYRRPDLDRALLTADGWVDTGDLGVLRDGRLTVTGREKDIIVVNGLKYGCLAIESTVEDIAGVEVSCTAALAHRDAASETDGLAIVFSPSAGGWATLPGLLRTIRDRVARRFGISPAWIVPLETDAIPRTASGKIQRGEIRARLTAGALDAALRRAIAEAGAAREGGEPRSPLERWLLDLWRETLTDPALGIHDNFFAWGGSSAKAAAIIARIADRLGVELRLRSLLEAPTVADLAARLLELAVADRDSALAE
jgi:acyl-CoA synthetase (AMP-forming)/AMP-acid ligase II